MESKSVFRSKINAFNAIVAAVVPMLLVWMPEHRDRILETALALTTVANIILRTFFTSKPLTLKGTGKVAVIFLAVALSACSWKTYERSKATFATLNTSYRVAQQVVIQLKRQGVITDADWETIKPINDRVAAIDASLFQLFAAIDTTKDAAKRDALLAELRPLLSEYIDLVEQVRDAVEEFKKR